jgi:hypothetical protein
MSKTYVKSKVNQFNQEVDAYRILSNVLTLIERSIVGNIQNLGIIQESYKFVSDLRDAIPKTDRLKEQIEQLGLKTEGEHVSEQSENSVQNEAVSKPVEEPSQQP